MLLIKGGADTTSLTSTGLALFDKLHLIPEKHQFPIFKALLEANINSSPDHPNFATRPYWILLWRSVLKNHGWCFAKTLLVHIERSNNLPKLKRFSRYTFVIAADHHLGNHKSRLVLWEAGDLNKESLLEDYEEYCAILRDCSKRQAAIDVS